MRVGEQFRGHRSCMRSNMEAEGIRGLRLIGDMSGLLLVVGKRGLRFGCGRCIVHPSAERNSIYLLIDR